MVCCSALNCNNNSKNGYRVFRFPVESRRRAIWTKKCGRGGNWSPGLGSRLCEVHFDEHQYENHRADGIKKLLPFAIPTLFDNEPNIPKRVYKKRSKLKAGKGSMEVSASSEILNEQIDKIHQMESEVNSLQIKLEDTNVLFQKFLTTEQVMALRRPPRKWSNESIIMGYKLRFNLGIHGYNYLRSTGYPIPSYSTLLKHLQNLEISFGIFDSLVEPLKFKVETLEEEDKKCVLCIDEIEINGDIDFDNGQDRITVALIRGIKHPWRQIIACEEMDASAPGKSMRQFVETCINFAESCGLYVTAVSSDMGTNNQALWSELAINITKQVENRNNKFVHNGHDVYVIADVCELLKKLKNAVLKIGLYLPNTLVANEDLPSNFVYGNYIYKLLELEMSKDEDLRTLRHLKKGDFYKTNVSAAVKFFSVKTAVALEVAVQSEVLPPAALTTAFFCRLINRWFSICASKVLKASITCETKESELDFLTQTIEIFHNTKIGNGWKPLNSGVILSTLSLCNVTEMLIENEYKAVFLHRFTLDAVEDVFSQIRESGSHLSAEQFLKAIKSIAVSQFGSDVKRSSYLNDSGDITGPSSSTMNSDPSYSDEHGYFLATTKEQIDGRIIF